MKFFSPLRTFTSALFHRSRVEGEMDEELHAHIRDRAEDLVRSGLSREEAQRRARVEFGGYQKFKEECREAVGVHFIETLAQDLRYAFRMLRKSPGFTSVAVLTLALGIGANTAIFTVFDAVLLKPLPYKDSSSLAIVWESEPSYGLLRNVVSPPNLFDWEQANHCFSAIAAFLDEPANLTGIGEPDQVGAQIVSPNFFTVLGVNPMLGRGFSPDENQKGKNHVVVLSYGLWKSKFGADPDIIGKKAQFDGEPFTIIGVMGPQFDFYISEFSFTSERPQIWVPWEETLALHDRTKVGRFLRVVARLNPGASLTQAQAQMNVIAAELAARYPDFDKGWGVTLVSLRDQLSGEFRPALLLLLGAVGLVLLIACANISSLLLSRAAGRKKEIAIRVALGASRKRIARQLLTESLVLGVFGGALGAIIGVWATESLTLAAHASLPDLSAIRIDWRLLAFAAGVTLFAGLLAGFWPSFLSARAEIASALPEGGRSSSAGRQSLAARSIFVVVEISLAFVLLASSSLLIRSFVKLTDVDPGFHISQLLTFQIGLPDSKYGQDQARVAFFTQLLNKIRVLPGVTASSADAAPPFSGGGSRTGFQIVGEPPLPPTQQPDTDVRVIEPDFFRAMDIPLLRGHTFNPSEFAKASNVVIVSKTFAEKYFRGKNPVGQKVIIDMKDTNLPSEIVGVVGDVHETSLSTAPFPMAYWPYPELPYNTMTFVVRSDTPPLSLVPAVREALHELDQDLPLAKISTMDQLVADSVARSRFTMLLLSVFAALALVLACIGIYGVMSYAVAQRTNEIGVRMALGAQRRDVLRLILGQGSRLAAIGVAIGIGVALVVTRLMTTLLFNVSATDPVTLLGVAILLALVALAACYIPARRAMKVDPMVALRYE